MGVLTASEYMDIRAALDVTLDEDALPDDIIERLPYAPTAELWLLARDPQAPTRAGVQQTYILMALVSYCASLLAPAMPNILAETQGPYVYSRQAVNWEARAIDLRGRAEQALGMVLQPTTPAVPAIPTMFALASGRRGA